MTDADPLPRSFPGGRLRRLRRADLSAFQHYRSLPELARFQGWSTMTDDEAAAFLDEMHAARLFRPGEWIQLGIADPATDALVGDLGLHLSEDGATAEIGFTLTPSAQGRGVATRAVGEALELLFSSTDVVRVVGITDARNGPSLRLLERVDFVRTETRQVEFRGERCTEEVYVLTRTAFRPRGAADRAD